MKKYMTKGWVVASLICLLIFLFFPSIFGETPVNLLGVGGRDGLSNLTINLFSYAVITILITAIIGLFSYDKRQWILSGVIGSLVMVFILFCYVVIYFTLFW